MTKQVRLTALFFGISCFLFNGFANIEHKVAHSNLLIPAVAVLTETPRSKVQAKLNSNKIPPLPNACFSASTPQWEIQLTLNETAGIPARLSAMTIVYIDNNLHELNQEVVNGSNLSSFFQRCGSDGINIPANGQLCGRFCVSLDGRKNGFLALAFIIADNILPGTYCVEADPITLLGPTNEQAADLSITNVRSVGSTEGVAISVNFLHKIVIRNDGPLTAKNVVMTDVIEPGATFQAVVVEQGSAATPAVGSVGTVTCFLGSISPGASVSVWLFLKNVNISGASVVNTASVTSSTNDPNLENNIANEAVGEGRLSTTSPGRLLINTTSSTNNVALGSRVSYTISVTNKGSESANTSMAFIIPQGTTFASAMSDKGFIFDHPSIGGTGLVLFHLYDFSAGLGVNETSTTTITLNVLSGGFLPDITNYVKFEGTDIQRFIIPLCGVALERPYFESTSADDVPLHPGPIVISGGGIINLAWSTPLPSAGDPTPAPVGFSLGGSALSPSDIEQDAASLPLTTERVAPSAVPCTLIGYKLYIADNPAVVNPANVWKILPPVASLTNAPRAPNGSYYALVAVYRCPDGSITDSQPTPVVSAGVAIPLQIIGQPFREGKKLVVLGQGFIEGAKLLINDQVYAKTIVESSTRLFGKKAGKTVQHNDKLQVRNPDGSLSNAVFY